MNMLRCCLLCYCAVACGAPWFIQTRFTTEQSTFLLKGQKCLAEQTAFKTISMYLCHHIESNSSNVKQKMYICYKMKYTYRWPWHGKTFLISFRDLGQCSL